MAQKHFSAIFKIYDLRGKDIFMPLKVEFQSTYKWRNLYLLPLIVLGTYYHSIVFGDFINLDYVDMMNHITKDPMPVLADLFFPKGAVKYYRPMVELSFRLDHFLWSVNPVGYHLTNVTLHLVNTYLVYWVSFLIFSKVLIETEAAAFLSALFFAINPLTTESVCWISGRSDIIAAFFILSSFLSYLLFKKNGRYLYLIPSGLLFMFGALTKEVALSLPVLIIAIEFLYSKWFSEKRDWKGALIVSWYFGILTVLYFFFRSGGGEVTSTTQIAGSTGVERAFQTDSIYIIFASIGFYIKKLFIPYPLNFAIYSINIPLYAILGIYAVASFSLWGIIRRDLYHFFATWVLITLSPAVVATVLGLPSVPWAERYLYVPLIGFSLGLGLGFAKLKEKHKKTAIMSVLLIASIFWATTFYRSYVWADELRLWEDTVRKSDIGRVHYLYGKALLDKGKEKEGIKQLEEAIAKRYSYYAYMTLADVKYNSKDCDGIKEIYRRAVKEYPKDSELYKYLDECNIDIAKYKKGDDEKPHPKGIDE